MNNVERFTGKSKNYAKFRPCYPQKYIDYLKTDVNLTKNSIVADIGSGTGILTNQLASECKLIYAVEPNADMMKMAKTELANIDNVIFVNLTAEQTNISENSVDLITVGQAFHWFDQEKFLIECKRILKPDGYVSLVWNNRDSSSECIKDNYNIFKKYCADFKGFSGGTDFSALYSKLSDFFKGEFEIKEFLNPNKLNREAFIGRCLSSSYAPNNNKDFIFELNKMFDKFSENDILDYPYITRCYTGKIK